jgi:hypothetical protein
LLAVLNAVTSSCGEHLAGSLVCVFSRYLVEAVVLFYCRWRNGNTVMMLTVMTVVPAVWNVTVVVGADRS